MGSLGLLSPFILLQPFHLTLGLSYCLHWATSTVLLKITLLPMRRSVLLNKDILVTKIIAFPTYPGFPGSPVSKEPTCRCRRLRFDPWVWKISWRRKQEPTLVFLPGESQGQRSLVDYCPQCCKEPGTTERLTLISNTLTYPGLCWGRKWRVGSTWLEPCLSNIFIHF